MYILNTKSGFEYPVDKYLKGIARINAAHYYLHQKLFAYKNIDIEIIKAKNIEKWEFMNLKW